MCDNTWGRILDGIQAQIRAANLLLSTFPDSLRRPTAASATQRNARVAALAHVVTGKLDVRAAAERIGMATS